METTKEDPPLECTETEFKDLVEQVSQLSLDEAKEELLDCARYGEVDAVRALLNAFPSIISTKDSHDNTALHKASANGHVTTVQLLINRGAALTRNDSGNTPLHWAAASGHVKVVELLLKLPSVNVLVKNDFGRSALTEGFTSKVTEVVNLLLQHDSASEDKLLSGGEKIDNDETEKASVIHEFALGENKEKTLRIRELPITDNPFGDSAVEDTTGHGIWCASLVMARWMASEEMRDRFSGRTLLELGAGCGVPGIAAAVYNDASKAYLSDLNPTTVDNLQFNVDLNENNDRCVACTMDWADESTWPDERVDFILGSDLIYQSFLVPLLINVIVKTLRENGRFLYVAPDTGRDGLQEFLEHESLQLICSRKAPEAYYKNPLKSGDQDEYFLHFSDLASSTYMLYEFRIRK